MDAEREKNSLEMSSQNRLQHLVNEVKKLLSSPTEVEVPPSSKFTWKIENFSKLKIKKQYSDVFTIGAHKWRVLIFPKGNGQKGVDQLSVYLDVANSASLEYGWSKHAQFSLAIVDQTYNKFTVRKDAQHQFTAKESDWGFTTFMPLSDLYNPAKGYFVNDTCIIEAEVVAPHTVCSESTPKPKPATQSGETVSLLKNPRAGQLFEEGTHGQIDETYENTGGFSILKAQAPLYKLIWLKYGHIASSKVLASYDAQVLIVADIMKSIIQMHQSHLNELSIEMVNTWEDKIKMAESLDFHIEWLRERFEEVKKDLDDMQKLEVELEDQSQSLSDAQARVTGAENEVKKLEAKLLAAKDELVKAQENKVALESVIKPVLANVEMCQGKGKKLLLDGLL